MRLVTFAKINGVVFKKCGPGWGGPIGFSTADAPNCTVCGYKSQAAAAEGWLLSLGLSPAGVACLLDALEAES